MHAQLFGGLGHGRIVEADFVSNFTLHTRELSKDSPQPRPLWTDPTIPTDITKTVYTPFNLDYYGGCVTIYVAEGVSDNMAKALWLDMMQSKAKYMVSPPAGDDSISQYFFAKIDERNRLDREQNEKKADWQYGDKL